MWTGRKFIFPKFPFFYSSISLNHGGAKSTVVLHGIESILSPEQQRRPLPSLWYKSFFYCISRTTLNNVILYIKIIIHNFRTKAKTSELLFVGRWDCCFTCSTVKNMLTFFSSSSSEDLREKKFRSCCMAVKYQYVPVTRYYCCFHCFCVQVLHLVAGGAVHRLDPHHTADDGRSALYLYSGQLYIYIYIYISIFRSALYLYSGQIYICIQVSYISIYISIFRSALYLYSGQHIFRCALNICIFRCALCLYSGVLYIYI